MSGPQCCENPPTLSPSSGVWSAVVIGGLKSYFSDPSDSKLAVIIASDVYGCEAATSTLVKAFSSAPIFCKYCQESRTRIAILLSVVCKVACGRVPFCASKVLTTGVGFGLVWPLWAVNKQRDTVTSISKNSDKLDMKEEEIMNNLDRTLN
ncbi:Uncharacterized protein Adt_16239 [Abeliophyllum distichum]|uniref:Uncharacterized protein n=1 Tax=Abeliophyllum distichum TaxID=126358 RepID=A0ABD1TD57_9LAMI